MSILSKTKVFNMIRVYEPGDLSSGFVGIRVAVSVNNKLKQKYWSRNLICSEFAMEHAIEYEQKLFLDQARYFNNRVFSKSSNTGITGLHLTFDVTRRRGNVYAYPRLSYHHLRNGELKSKGKVLSDYNISDDVWFEMCNYIRNARVCTNANFDKLIAAKPSYEKVKKILSPQYDILMQP